MLQKYLQRGTWVAQWVKQPTVDIGTDQLSQTYGMEPRVGLCTDIAEFARDSVSPSPSPLLVLSLSKSNDNIYITQMLQRKYWFYFNN